MLQIVIIDNDKYVTAELIKHIQNYYEAADKLVKITTFATAEAFFKMQELYEVAFLEIDLSGLNGIELARRIREYDWEMKIIYVTKCVDYQLDAFSVHAFGYLIKPVSKGAVYAMLDDVEKYQINKLQTPKVVFLKTNKGSVEVEVKDILYMECLERKVRIVTKEKCFNILYKMKDVIERFEKYGFISPHKSFIVNLNEIIEMKGFVIYMSNGGSIPVAQKKAPEIRKKWKEHVLSGI